MYTLIILLISFKLMNFGSAKAHNQGSNNMKTDSSFYLSHTSIITNLSRDSPYININAEFYDFDMDNSFPLHIPEPPNCDLLREFTKEMSTAKLIKNISIWTPYDNSREIGFVITKWKISTSCEMGFFGSQKYNILTVSPEEFRGDELQITEDFLINMKYHDYTSGFYTLDPLYSCNWWSVKTKTLIGYKSSEFPLDKLENFNLLGSKCLKKWGRETCILNNHLIEFNNERILSKCNFKSYYNTQGIIYREDTHGISVHIPSKGVDLHINYLYSNPCNHQIGNESIMVFTSINNHHISLNEFSFDVKPTPFNNQDELNDLSTKVVSYIDKISEKVNNIEMSNSLITCSIKLMEYDSGLKDLISHPEIMGSYITGTRHNIYHYNNEKHMLYQFNSSKIKTIRVAYPMISCNNSLLVNHNNFSSLLTPFPHMIFHTPHNLHCDLIPIDSFIFQDDVGIMRMIKNEIISREWDSKIKEQINLKDMLGTLNWNVKPSKNFNTLKLDKILEEKYNGNIKTSYQIPRSWVNRFSQWIKTLDNIKLIVIISIITPMIIFLSYHLLKTLIIVTCRKSLKRRQTPKTTNNHNEQKIHLLKIIRSSSSKKFKTKPDNESFLQEKVKIKRNEESMALPLKDLVLLDNF